MLKSVPPGWHQKTLGDIAHEKLNNGIFRKNPDYSDIDSSGLPVVWVSELFNGTQICTDKSRRLNPTTGEVQKYGLRHGDILFCRSSLKLDGIGFSNVYLGKDFQALFECHVIRISPNPKFIYPKFLNHFLRTESARNQIKARSKTSTMTTIDQDGISSLSISFPELAEQRRIATILDQVEVLRARRREAMSHVDSLTQSIFIEMFGDPVRNSKGWPLIPFGEICETRLGKMLDQKQQTGNHVRKYLRNANVQWFRFDLSDVNEMDFDEKARNIFQLKYGDLLICEGGEPGRAAIWRDELSDCYYQKALHRCRPRHDKANSEYLVWLMWFLAKRGGLSDHVTAATIAHLTSEKLKAMRIPVPPLAIQTSFANRLRVLTELKERHSSHLLELDTLFASIQHRAFRGEL